MNLGLAGLVYVRAGFTLLGSCLLNSVNVCHDDCVSLCVWQDLKPLEVYAVEFLVDNSQLAFVGESVSGRLDQKESAKVFCFLCVCVACIQ